MLSLYFWRFFQGDPSGVDLTLTFESTGSGSARILPTGVIVVDLAAALHTKYVQLTTPINFKVIDMHTIHGNATACTVALENTTDVVISAITVAASDKDIDRAADIDDTYHEFGIGDDDLRLQIETAAFTGRAIIAYEPL